ncbi:MAG: hypothetical protein CM15mP31_5010 [Gammaproteobacteria bacterium]|nr:MAG: hypothetical protein CM15mP31_5010 [Gammaproteobacteria bacterium]
MGENAAILTSSDSTSWSLRSSSGMDPVFYINEIAYFNSKYITLQKRSGNVFVHLPEIEFLNGIIQVLILQK